MSEEVKQSADAQPETTKAPEKTPAGNQVNPTANDNDYIKELRNENKEHRLKNKELEQKAKEAEEKAQRALQQVDEYAKKSNDRIIRAELKAQAVAAGMHDLDGLKLADLSSITLDDHGDVVGAEELIAKLKETKPYLFKEFISTTSNPNLPKPNEAKAKKATDMDDTEWAKEKARLGIR